jgi:hypothetical protein
MPFAVPMVWCEPSSHLDHCYFWLTNITGFSVQSKHKIEYPNISSALRPQCQCWSHQKSTVWTQNQKRLHLKLGQVRGKTQDFSAYSIIQPHLITQAVLNDLVRDLDLPKTKAQLLGSRLQQWSLLENGVKVSLYRKRQANIASYFSIDGDLVYCSNICGLMKKLQLQHAPDQWMLFISSSKHSLKQAPFNPCCSCSPHERNLCHHSRFAGKNMLQRPPVEHTCRRKSCDIADWAMRRLYEMLLLPV